MVNQSITFKYILAVMMAVIVTWLLHEFAHWLVSELLGYESIMRINSVSRMEGQDPIGIHDMYIAAAGPLVTIIQAFIVYYILRANNWNKYLYPLLFIPFYMRLMAGFMNFIKHNDEGRISTFFELGTFTIPILVIALLFLLVYGVSKKYKLHWKFQLATTIFVMISSSILILADQFYGIRII
ncbi:hypothetical protein ACFQ1M_07955 [Sungkyunkwania multivorans]|uniref:Peptidase M50 domain-containing protein n=1 Tax=Sungkyunkwania multivorans TaxID=1173618 RepID=A0ABW3CWJ0_9FLAO